MENMTAFVGERFKSLAIENSMTSEINDSPSVSSSSWKSRIIEAATRLTVSSPESRASLPFKT
jgi:hypothetical protein